MRNIIEANFTFYATLTVEGNVIKNVLCHLYLPIKIIDEIELNFQLSKEQLKTLYKLRFWKYAVNGEIKDSVGKIQTAIVANNVYSNNLKLDTEKPFIGEATDLTITNFSDNPSINKFTGKFWITSNSLLQPALIGNPTMEGNIVRRFDFEPYENLSFKFGVNPENYEDAESDIFSELVVNFELDSKANHNLKINDTLRVLDDILLLASFAARERCVCLRWDYSDGKNSTLRYLKDRMLPDNSDRKGNKREELIDLSDIKEFINTAFPNLQNYSNIEAFRRTLNFVFPNYKETVDSNFVSLYSALEMIVLHFRKNSELEEILSPERFKEFRKSLEKYIKQLDLSVYLEKEIQRIDESKDEYNKREEVAKLIKDKRKLIKQKLGELNRVSFSEAFIEFREHYKVDLLDLWEVTGSKGDSLSEIRNKLVHGEHFYPKHYNGLFYAREHLRWIIERMILSILGWSIEKSNVSRQSLRFMSPYLNWHKEKENFVN